MSHNGFIRLSHFDFRTGPKLPNQRKLSGHSLVTLGKSLVVLGGKGNFYEDMNHEIYKLKCSNGKFTWEKLPQKLKIGRTEFVAIPIPDSMAKCK